MGTFRRSGTFKDRGRFLEALQARFARLQEGALRGSTLEWSEEGGTSRAVLTGFGARVVFDVKAADWECVAEVPGWLPQSLIEDKFDREFGDLGSL